MTGYQTNAGDSARRRWHRTILGLGVLFVLVFVLSACGDDLVTEWVEEVQLSDGRVIEIERRSQGERVGPMGSGETLPIEESIRFKSSTAPAWRDVRVPILLDRDARNGELVLICTSADSRVWEQRGQPAPPYWQFRLRGDQWVEQALDADFFGKATNLVPTPAWLKEHRGVATIEQKQRWFDAAAMLPRYRSINRDSRFGID